MSIRRGTRPVTKLYRGTREVVKACRGTRAVYEKPAAKILVSIAVTAFPTVTSYEVGDALDLTGIAVRATYSDSSTADVTAACAFSPADGDTLTTAGAQTVTVSYTEGGVTATTSFGITVVAQGVTLSSLAITTLPGKVHYAVGETLDLTGLAVTATYSDSSTADVTAACGVSPAGGSILASSGPHTATATYTYNGTTKTAQFVVSAVGTSTATLLYLTLTSSLTQKLHYAQFAQNDVTVDWGDGTTPTTAAGTSKTEDGVTVYRCGVSHTWALMGGYVVAMSVSSGVTWQIGHGITALDGGNLLDKAGAKSTTSPELVAVRFGAGCAGIRAQCFMACTSLTSIEIPSSISVIMYAAFSQCTALVSINIPASVSLFGGPAAAVGGSVFYQDTALKYVEIAAPTVDCAENFVGCSALEKVWIRSSVDTIDNYTYTNASHVSYTYGICTGANTAAVLYCEDAAVQSGWGSYWDKRDVNTETTGFATFGKVFGQSTRPW